MTRVDGWKVAAKPLMGSVSDHGASHGRSVKENHWRNVTMGRYKKYGRVDGKAVMCNNCGRRQAIVKKGFVNNKPLAEEWWCSECLRKLSMGLVQSWILRVQRKEMRYG